MATERDIQRAVFRANATAAEVNRLAQVWPISGYSNCVLWAMRQRATFGGALILRPSQYGPWEHVQWLDPDDGLWEFDALAEKVPQAQLPTLYEGRVKRVR